MRNLPDLNTIRRLESEKLVNVRALDDLIIVNYTVRCQYKAAWNHHTTVCRGLILRLDAPWPDGQEIVELVALPMRKFFNVGEADRWPSGPVLDVTEKLDGQMGILYRHGGQYCIATRGAFHSEFACWATDFFRQEFPTLAVPAQYTLLFEIIAPQFRLVVNYGDREDLVLLAVRDRYSGADLPMSRVAELNRDWGFSLPTFYEEHDWKQLVAAAKTLPANREGWVIRMADGKRWKVKGSAYRQLFAIMVHLTPRQILEALAHGTIDDLMASLPEELYPEADGWRREYVERACAHLAAVAAVAVPEGTPADVGRWISAHPLRDYLFLARRGQDVLPLIYKRMLEGKL